MKVNKAKTQLLCITAGQDEAKAYINTEQGRIQSSAELKILGFTFETRPDLGTHVEKMKMKLRSRYWGMCNLKNCSLSESKQLYIYKTTVRPVAEFTVPSFNSLMTGQMSEDLEKIQHGILKTIVSLHHFPLEFIQALVFSPDLNLDLKKYVLFQLF